MLDDTTLVLKQAKARTAAEIHLDVAFFAKTSVQQVGEAFIPRGRAEPVQISFSFSHRRSADPAQAPVSCRRGLGCALSLQELHLGGKESDMHQSGLVCTILDVGVHVHACAPTRVSVEDAVCVRPFASNSEREVSAKF